MGRTSLQSPEDVYGVIETCTRVNLSDCSDELQLDLTEKNDLTLDLDLQVKDLWLDLRHGDLKAFVGSIYGLFSLLVVH